MILRKEGSDLFRKTPSERYLAPRDTGCLREHQPNRKLNELDFCYHVHREMLEMLSTLKQNNLQVS